MNSAIGIARPGLSGKRRLLKHAVLLVAAIGLGVGAGFGIVSALDGGSDAAPRYSTLAGSQQDYPGVTIYLVRDEAQAVQVDNQVWGSLGAATGLEVAPYRIVIDGTPVAEALFSEQRWMIEAGYDYPVVDLRATP
jgi:hypothetical protein